MARLLTKTRLGKRRVYDIKTATGDFFARSRFSDDGSGWALVHNSHQLSRDALDALLKPLEDNMPGSEDKMLTCIFATTEPEKMRATVLSRCAPAFVIQPQKPALIAERLQYICEQEGIKFEPEMLTLVAEITECHIRDALKAVEGVSMLGGVTKENVRSYLHLDLNVAYLDLLDAIGTDLPAAFDAAKRILERASPVTAYQKLSEVVMLAFRASLGEQVPSHWGKERLMAMGASKGVRLLGYASRFAIRPGRPTAAMLMMDIAHLHHVGGSVVDPQVILQVQAGEPIMDRVAESTPAPILPVKTKVLLTSEGVAGIVPNQDVSWVAAQSGPAAVKRTTGLPRSIRSTTVSPERFTELLRQALADLEFGDGGSS